MKKCMSKYFNTKIKVSPHHLKLPVSRKKYLSVSLTFWVSFVCLQVLRHSLKNSHSYFKEGHAISHNFMVIYIKTRIIY